MSAGGNKIMSRKAAFSVVCRFMKSATWRRAQERFLAATPEQRWALHVGFWKSRGLSSVESRRKAGWGRTHEEQKNSVQAILSQKEFVKYLAARHGFEP
jgi:hypothetical protein